MTKFLRAPWLLFAVFIAPILLTCALSLSKYSPDKTTNKGHLFNQTYLMTNVSSSAHTLPKRKWLLTVYQPNQCDQKCLKRIEEMEWLFNILGKKKHQTQLVYISNNQLNLSKSWIHLPITNGAVFNGSQKIIFDPLQRAVMSYTDDQSIKDTLKDMKKLIMFSRSLI